MKVYISLFLPCMYIRDVHPYSLLANGHPALQRSRLPRILGLNSRLWRGLAIYTCEASHKEQELTSFLITFRNSSGNIQNNIYRFPIRSGMTGTGLPLFASPSNSSLRSVAQRTRVQVLFEKNTSELINIDCPRCTEDNNHTAKGGSQ